MEKYYIVILLLTILFYVIINFLIIRIIKKEVNFKIYSMAAKSILYDKNNEYYGLNPDKYTNELLKTDINIYINKYLEKGIYPNLNFFYIILIMIKLDFLLIIKYIKEQLPNIIAVVSVLSLVIGLNERRKSYSIDFFNIDFFDYIFLIIFFSIFIFYIGLCNDYIFDKKIIECIILNESNKQGNYSNIFYKVYKDNLNYGVLSGLFIFLIPICLFIFLLTFFDLFEGLKNHFLNFNK